MTSFSKIFVILSMVMLLSAPFSASAQTLDEQVQLCKANLIVDTAEGAPSEEAIAEEMADEAKHNSDLAIVGAFKTGFGAVIGVMDTVLFYELFPETIGFPEVGEDCEVVQRGFPFVVFCLSLVEYGLPSVYSSSTCVCSAMVLPL